MGVINALSHAKLPPTNIHPQEAKAVKELAKDDDIVILPADKGRATVVMDSKDYSAKMLMMIGDRDTYQLMAKHLLREQDEQCFAETTTRRPPFWQDLLPSL